MNNLSSAASLVIGGYLVCSGGYGIINGSKKESHKKDWGKIALGVSAIALAIGLYDSSIQKVVPSSMGNANLDQGKPDALVDGAQSHFLPKYVDLSDPDVLENYLANKDHKLSAAMIAGRLGKARSIANTSYGVAFPMNPELLAYAMEKVKGKTVLEVAGASGENAILLAFAGAKEVYMNDIDPTEVETFETLKDLLPQEIAGKLKTLKGDIFQILDKNSELSNKIDLVFSRNFIHFLNNERQVEFFKSLKKTMKVGGEAIFTANALYPLGGAREIIESNPDATSFEMIQGLLYDWDRGAMPVARLFDDVTPCLDDLVGNDYKDLRIAKARYGQDWEVDVDELSKLDDRIQKKIMHTISENLEQILPVQSGLIKTLTSWVRLFNKNTLSNLLANNGFTVDSIFMTKQGNGHLLQEGEDFYEHGHQIGGVARNL